MMTGGVDGFRRLHDRQALFHVVDVEGRQRIVMLRRMIQNCLSVILATWCSPASVSDLGRFLFLGPGANALFARSPRRVSSVSTVESSSTRFPGEGRRFIRASAGFSPAFAGETAS
jgi:hypothetical protein